MRYLELLEKALDRFQRLKALATKQNELISENSIEAFLVLSSKREPIQTEISEYEREYGALRNNIPAGGLEKIRSISKKINDAIKNIGEIDLKNEERILQKGNELFAEIKNLRQGQKALKGYGSKALGNPRFIDRKS